MVTPSNAMFASSRRERSGGLLVAAAIFFAVALGGSGAMFGAYTGNAGQFGQASAAAHKVAA